VGSEEVLTWIKRSIETALDIEIDSNVRYRADSGIYCFQIHKHQKIVLEYLYENATVFLNRKYKRAQQVING
jgi:hypothetical protein